jgi:hypothetical protein
MTALVAVETVLLVLLVVLVAGLLRSHAEILRRLGQAEERRGREGASPAGGAVSPLAAGTVSPPSAAAGRSGAQLLPAPIAGSTPHGDAIALAFDGAGSRPTLLAFLTTGCSTCAAFWESLAEPRLPTAVQTVVVTRGAERERPARLRELAPDGIPVVMSSEAWEDYAVRGAPYFVLVDGIVRGEGVATTWQALASLVRDAIEDQGDVGSADAGTRRARLVDETLAAAGIGPDHPSLYPGRGASGGRP